MSLHIYPASSWRNQHFPTLVNVLRGFGHEVYNFREANASFDWEMDGNPGPWDAGRRKAALNTQEAMDAFINDKVAIEDSDALILVMPCGRSAHLEAGFAAGRGIPVFVLDLEGQAEPELMLKFADGIFQSIPEVLNALSELETRNQDLDRQIQEIPNMSNHELRRLEGASH